jgi:hypothetical protein
MLGYGSVYDLLKLVMQIGKVKKWKREWDAIAARWTPLSSLPVFQFDRNPAGKVKSRAQYTPATDLETLAEIVMLAHGNAAHIVSAHALAESLNGLWELLMAKRAVPLRVV